MRFFEWAALHKVVVPYYLSQGYNGTTLPSVKLTVVVPYYLSQGYNYLILCNK